MAAASKPADREVTVGVRELKSNLSGYLRRVKAGQSVVTTEHGLPIARVVREIGTAPRSLDERMDELIRAGVILRKGRKLRAAAPTARTLDGGCVSDLISEQRD